jgi:hypothetical protein
MTAPQWFSGPPPARGWWPASVASVLARDVYRWWDGSNWSQPAYRSEARWIAEVFAAEKGTEKKPVMWRHWSIDIDGTDGKGAHE